MSTRARYLRLVPAVAVIFGVLIAVGVVYWVKQLLGGPITPPKPVVTQITLVQPPPPPPPPPEPPPPEPEQPIETPQPEPVPDAPQDQPADDTPPGDDLGVDSDGSGSGDGFGLLGKKGGRSLIGGGGDARLTWYTRRLDQDLSQFFNEYKELRKLKSYTVKLNLWIDASGRVERFQVVDASGKELKETIRTVLGDLARVSPPPEGTPQPVRLRLISRG